VEPIKAVSPTVSGIFLTGCVRNAACFSPDLLRSELKWPEQAVSGKKSIEDGDLVMEDYAFTVMNKDRKITDVEIKNNKVNVIKYSMQMDEQPFYGGPVDLERVYLFLESRCMDRNRDCLDEYLDWLGLDEYNPYKIVKKTHGVMWEDFFWLRFPGEDITWKDVRIRGAD